MRKRNQRRRNPSEDEEGGIVRNWRMRMRMQQPTSTLKEEESEEEEE